MTPDYPYTTRTAMSLGYREGSYDERREYGAVVVHITGSGPLSRYNAGWRPAWAGLDHSSSLLDVCLAIYRGLSHAGPHYVVYGAHIVQLCPEDLAAWHVGTVEVSPRVYEHEDWYARTDEDVTWWRDRWPQFRSPLELADGRLWGEERSANRGSVGIEVLWPHDEQRSGWSPATRRSLEALLQDICDRRSIPHRPDCVVGHSDAHPASRTSHGAPWDPPASLWTPVVAADMLGVPRWCVG